VLATLVRPAGDTTMPFIVLAVASALLLVLGLVMTFSASVVRSTADTGDAFGIFGRQLLWCALGIPALLITATMDYRLLRRIAVPLLAVSVAGACLVLVPGLGEEVNGARRWFDFGPVSFQPSELLKLSVPLALAHLMATRWARVRRGDVSALLLPALPLLGVVGLAVALGPDLETALLVVAIGGVVLYASGLPLRLVAGLSVLGCALGAVGVAQANFRQGRIAAWLDPASDPSNFGYQTRQGFLALGSGGNWGVGLGRGRGKWLYVPNAHTDFIYAILGEELGLLGTLSVLLLFVGVAVAGVLAARRAPDPFGRLIATAITTWLLLQAALNIGSVVGLFPVTGVTLPLVSFGGSSLLVTMAGIGVLLSVARAGTSAGGPRSEKPRTEKPVTEEPVIDAPARLRPVRTASGATRARPAGQGAA
jgi:cell division protein FtsW